MNDTNSTPASGTAQLDPLLDVAAVAAHLSLGERTFRRWLSCGAFPQPDVRLRGRLLRWKRSTVDSWVGAQEALKR